MCAVVLICLAFWLTAIMLAARRPGFAHVRPEKMHAGVRGGRHLATGGRSVSPTRDAPVTWSAEGDARPLASAADDAAALDNTGVVPLPRTPGTRTAEPASAAAGPPSPRVSEDQEVLRP
jgi:hypothetical protein